MATLSEQNAASVEALELVLQWIDDKPQATAADIRRWIDYKRRGHKGHITEDI